MSHDDPQALSEESAAVPDREPTIGERLRVAREAQPLSVAQISAELRIEPKFLAALEEDRLEDFPAPVFTKGYLKQYGRILGLDERDLLAQYYRQVDVRDAPVIPTKPIRLRDENQIRHWVAGGVVLCLLGGGIAAWWVAQPEAVPLVAERAAAPMPVVSVPVTADSVAPAGEETGFAPDVTVGPASAEPSTALPAAAEVPVGVADVQVELSFTEDCWTEISDSEGERLFYGLGSAGARSRFNATLPISIFFGNAGGVDLTVNGDRYPIPTGSRQGNLARFVIAEPGP